MPARRTSTSILLSCAAIGVGGGLVAGASGYLAAAFAVFGPMLYGLTAGTHFLPSVVGLSLLRRPGTGLLTGLIAGLVGAAFAPWWFGRYLGTGLLVGLLLEIPFLVTRYRRWDPWMFYVSGAFAGLVLAVGVFFALGAEHYAWWAWVIALAAWVLSPVLFIWIGRVIANALERAGVARSARTAANRE
ncbi:ECF transporter S component [Agromyces larvae]|uniref:ECF transporter S component n=1 Tax=Agromyces larvae TaxID=2929802 RepID=A0ABY4C6D1_9MICO|nr:ECF transporter S component [Agromyces larvae]UOE45553.1 ECF transporter S component [Agromyces larvae]